MNKRPAKKRRAPVVVPRVGTFIRAVNGKLVTDMLKGKQEVPK